MAGEIRLPYEYGQAAYFYELERRDQLSNRENSAYILLSLVIGGLASILLKISQEAAELSGAIIVTIILGIIAVATAVKPLIENRFSKTRYKHAETPVKLNEICVNYYNISDDKDATSRVILDHLMIATDHNTSLNDTRAQRLHVAEFRIAIAITFGIFILFSSTTYAILYPIM